MIKPAERKKMKKVFKKGYSKEVLEKLNENGIVTQKGTPYGISYITHVFNGRNENTDIEKTIVGLYAEKKEEKKKIAEEKKAIFTKKKPEAGTPGLI
ncbi:hypothetical protein RT99_06055 [Flavobacterium sp. MEB061]|uniref:hypothetical protein n=1 Tax=Flavobacterium sp. MEB061 TaxID=1587524 RepID=UPI0005AC828B|nr:hypothetical protein [Flavobacterium sp. MEB061]KIQ22665.1 hypothetical protein RT99_06055 [Flavobacterium sp. MEB061]